MMKPAVAALDAYAGRATAGARAHRARSPDFYPKFNDPVFNGYRRLVETLPTSVLATPEVVLCQLAST